ncbi:MAG: hypothetical protein PHG63_01060, partial [Candidatus Dojkabacteria bacterium]|nr:hypothetical protein [Candidatus Dojkabacteria bacterium]
PSASAVYAQQIPIQPLQIEQNLEMVPYYGVPISGDVLQAQGGRSPISDMCNGSDMSSNSFVCSEFSSGDDVEDSVSGHTFNKSCDINVVYATYPSFFHGGDFYPPAVGDTPAGDGRIDFWRGEWPSFSDVSGRTTPDADYVAGVGLVPGDEYHWSNATNYPPNQNPGYGENTANATAAEYRPYVADSGQVENAPGTNGSDGESMMAIGPCDNPPTEEIRIACESVVKAHYEWYDESYYTPDPEKRIGRPISDSGTCPLVENVNYNVACINAGTFLQGWLFSWWGVLSNVSCLFNEEACYEDVQLMLLTDSIVGTNDGCEEPCGDMVMDMQNSSTSPPDPSRECSSYTTGNNNPCWPDRYIGTPGLCTVCGRFVPCTFIWKNWLFDNYSMLRKESPHCIIHPEDEMCTFEGYFEKVIELSGGISGSLHP